MGIDVKIRVSDDGTTRVVEGLGKEITGVGDAADKSAARASQAFDVLKKSALATAAAVGTAVAAGSVAVARQFQQIDEIAKVSRGTGVAVKDLSELQVAADLAGVSLEGLGTSLGLFSRRIVEARAGGRAAGIFESLGVDVNSVRDTSQLLELVADRFQLLGEGAETTALAMELFGRSGARLINLLGQGGEAIRDARAEAIALGLGIENGANQAVEDFNDNVSRMWGFVDGLARSIAVDLAPEMADITGQAVGWAKANREVISSGLKEYLEGVGPLLKTTVDGLLLLNSGLDAIADIGVFLRVGSTENTDISRQVARRFQDRGMSRWDLDTPGGMSTQRFPVDLGGGIDDFARMAAAQATAAEKSKEHAEWLERIRASISEVSAGTQATARESGAVASAAASTADEFGRIGELAELVPVELSGVTSEIEAAQVAAVNLGEVLSDSLISAVDSLIAGGDFDLGDVLEATGKAAMSRMVGAMIKEKLGFDAVFRANFLEYLPGIASQGADAISRSFGLGMQSLASQAANAGQVVSGGLGGAFTAPPNFAGASGGVVTFVDDFGQTITAPAAQAGAASAVSQGFTPGAAAAGGAGIGAGLLGGLAIGGTLIGGQIAGSLAGSGAFGSRAQANSSLFGAATAAAIAAPFTFGLAPLALALLGSRPPSAQERRRMAIGDAYRESGLFPSLAFAKNPGSTFRDAPIPGFIDGMSPELSALSLIYGGTANDAFGRIQGTIGSRASVLGLSEEQVRREIRTVAGASGVSLGTAVGDLNTRFLEAQINSKGDLSPSQYLDLVTGTISILGEDLPAGVDAAAVALANLEQVGGFAVVELQAFGEELERQKNLATTLQGGVAGAGQSAITALLTGGDPSAAFRSGLLNAAAGGISSQLVGTLFADGGPLGAALTEAVLGGDPDALGAAIASAGDSLEMLTSAAEKFVPVLAGLIDVVEEGTDSGSLVASGYRDARGQLQSRIRDARFQLLSPGEQRAQLERDLARDRARLEGFLADSYIGEDERTGFDAAINRYSTSAFALLNQRGQFAEGSPQQRAIESAALGALDYADTALEIAAASAVVGDMSVSRMTVDQIIISQGTAAGLVGGL